MAEQENMRSGNFKRVVCKIGKVLYHLRSFFLAIPVGIAAVVLAIRNMTLLPEMVGINVLASGEYQWMIDRNLAVMAPIVLTAVCLLMMFLSRRVIYPWLISIFSLVLPILLIVTNIFPA